MSPRAVGTRRPRLLPGALVASGLVVATACTVLAATDPARPHTVRSCAGGQEWVTVRPVVVVVSDWAPAHVAADVSLAGCVDTRDITPRQPAPDTRG